MKYFVIFIVIVSSGISFTTLWWGMKAPKVKKQTVLSATKQKAGCIVCFSTSCD